MRRHHTSPPSLSILEMDSRKHVATRCAKDEARQESFGAKTSCSRRSSSSSFISEWQAYRRSFCSCKVNAKTSGIPRCAYKCQLVRHKCHLMWHKCHLIWHRCHLIGHRCHLIGYRCVIRDWCRWIQYLLHQPGIEPSPSASQRNF